MHAILAHRFNTKVKSIKTCITKVSTALNLSPDTVAKSILLRSSAEELLRVGVTIVPVLTRKEVTESREDFITTAQNFPEYLYSDTPEDTLYVGGGFGAFGNPSSFHNPFVRELREKAMHELTPVFKHLNQLECRPTRKLEQLIDRMRIHSVGQTVSKESWHRDESTSNRLRVIGKNGITEGEEDYIFGGWINLDAESQYFICAPKTHRDKPKARGFGKIKDIEKVFKKHNTEETKIEVPSGWAIIFYQHILHRVAGGKRKGKNAYRLFLGWRLTDDTQPLFDDTFERISRGATVRIPSGQEPPIYPQLYWTFWREKLEKWSTLTFKPEVLIQREVESGNEVGKVYTIVPRFMNSLKDMNLWMYPPYEQYELDMLVPHEI